MWIIHKPALANICDLVIAATLQMLIQSTTFYPYFGRKLKANRTSQSRDNMLLVASYLFAVYTAMTMVSNNYIY